MRIILITYIIAINLTGFVLMGIDKRKAMRNRWRISERTLFLIALLFGCVGVWLGMYAFHHKTLHRSFRIGLPLILALQLLLILSGAFLYQRFTNSPTQTVRHELSQISEPDAGTLASLISDSCHTGSQPVSANISNADVNVIALFFRKFKYDIQSEKIEGDLATVTADITNIDMHALAQDLCTKLLKESVSVYPESSDDSAKDYYQLLGDTLNENTYNLVTTTATFHLQKERSRWTILSDNALEDELTGGFISYMNDPYILPASASLSIQLDALKALTAEQWADYLSVNDIFATCNADYSRDIDAEYIRQLAKAFDYEILRCTENGDRANAAVRITSIDMKKVLDIYKNHLLSYAATTKSLRDDDTQFSNETARLLLQSLQENTAVTSTDINISFRNNGSIWDISFNQEFTNALMGNMSGAINQFNSVTNDYESKTVIVAPVD